MTMFDRPLDLITVALKEGLHATVRKVSHPAPESKLGRNIACKRTIENPLHSSLNQEMRPCELHKVIIAKKGSPKAMKAPLLRTGVNMQ